MPPLKSEVHPTVEPFVASFPAPTVPLGQSPTNIVLFFPGIRTNADWIERIKHDVREFYEPVEVVKIASSNVITEYNLISRIGLAAEREQCREQAFRLIAKHSESDISIVCHSLGCDIFCDIMAEYNYYWPVKFKHVIFLGSVCSNHKIGHLRKYVDKVINVRGSCDQWPLMASIARPFTYEPTGCFGFNRSDFVEDILTDLDHDSCVSDRGINEYVLSTVRGIKAPLNDPRNIVQIFDRHGFFLSRKAVYALLCAAAIIALSSILTGITWLLAVSVISIAICVGIILRYAARVDPRRELYTLLKRITSRAK